MSADICFSFAVNGFAVQETITTPLVQAIKNNPLRTPPLPLHDPSTSPPYTPHLPPPMQPPPLHPPPLHFPSLHPPPLHPPPVHPRPYTPQPHTPHPYIPHHPPHPYIPHPPPGMVRMGRDTSQPPFRGRGRRKLAVRDGARSAIGAEKEAWDLLGRGGGERDEWAAQSRG